MNFANASLLAGAAAAVVPLVIHLLNRNQVRTLDWGATHLLDAAVVDNPRRPRLQNWLLLLVRCAIPVVLALAMARPLLRSGGGGESSAVVFVVDDSRSMAATGAGGSRWQHLTEDVDAALRSVGGESQFAVVLAGGPPRSLFETPVYRASTVRDGLRDIGPTAGPVDAAAAMAEAMSAASAMTVDAARIVVLSDFQTADWKGVATELSDGGPAVSFVSVASDANPNIAVGPVEVSHPRPPVGQPVTIAADVRATGDGAAVDASLLVDGREVAVQELRLDEGETARVRFDHAFAEAKTVVAAISVNGDDALDADNKAVHVLSVGEPVRVLLVEDEPGDDPLAGAGGYLSLALSVGGTFEVDTVAADSVTSDDVVDADVVVLCGVRSLRDGGLLTNFVNAGGGLLAVAGPEVVDWDGLPAEWGRPRSRTARPLAGRYEHPALASLNRTGVRLDDATINTVSRITRRDGSEVLLRTDAGDPLLLSRSLGNGLVLQWTSTLDETWGDLPVRPIFVPLVHGLVASLAPVRERLNISPGETAVVRGSGRVRVQDPDGRARNAGEVGDDRFATLSNLRQPGRHTVTASKKTTPIVVSCPLSESNLATAQDEQLAAVADRFGATLFANAEAAVRGEDGGRSIWVWLLGAFVALLFGELWLQRRLAGAGRR